MKLIPAIVTIVLALSTLGYGLSASGQTINHCTASTPCAKICGDHPCAPGEVYSPGGSNTTSTNTSSTNGTKTPAIATQVNIAANATATKTVNGTAVQNMANVAKPANATTIPPPAPAIPSPAKQVASGTSPADVKCPSGYQLVLNKFDSRPACVTSDILAKLVARGWAAGSS